MHKTTVLHYIHYIYSYYNILLLYITLYFIAARAVATAGISTAKAHLLCMASFQVPLTYNLIDKINEAFKFGELHGLHRVIHICCVFSN